MGPRAILDAVVKSSQPPPGIEPHSHDRPARSLVAIPTELSRILPDVFFPNLLSFRILVFICHECKSVSWFLSDY
jgi:hypothetical protein